MSVHAQKKVIGAKRRGSSGINNDPGAEDQSQLQSLGQSSMPMTATTRHAVTMAMPLSQSHSSDHNHQGSPGQVHNQSNSQPHGNSIPNTTTPLFQLVNFPSRLVLDNVYLNGLHSLRRFGIKNTSQTDIIVKMRSSLGSQISFQLTNENLPFDPEVNGGILQTISTNTAAAAEAGSLTATGHQFNQLFNLVGLIDEVTVKSGETEYVILGFLPDPRGWSRRGKWDSGSNGTDVINANASHGSAHGDGVQIYDDNRQRDIASNGLLSGDNEEFEADDQQTDNFDSFEVNGLVFFFAYKITSVSKEETLPATILEETNLSSSPPPIHAFANDLAATAGTITLGATAATSKPMSGAPSHESSVSSVSTAQSATPHKADYQHTVKFRSTVCWSVLYSNIGETGINFEDCAANQEYVKDFTIWNRSEIPLYWQLNTVDVGSGSRESWLKFVDYEGSFGGNDVDEGIDHVDEQGVVHHSRTIRSRPIPSYGYRRIRVIFRPRENGDFLYDLSLENLNDASNIEEAAIHATVRAVSRGEDTLAISTGSTMDFGDCCAGMWTRLPMTFSNTGMVPTEIHLKVEGAEVVFDIQTEAGADISEAATDSTKEVKSLLDPDIQSSWYESSRRSESSANTDQHLESNPSSLNAGRGRLRDWMEDGSHPPSAVALTSAAHSMADSTGAKGGDRVPRELGIPVDSGPPSPVTSEGFFPDNIQQINSNVEKYLAGQELVRVPRDGNDGDLESEADSTGVQDSLTTGTSHHHKKRPSLRSISFSGAQREKELAQSQLLGPQSPVRGNQSTTRIEELFVKPGKERTVIVSYRPARDASIENFQAGKLLRKSFRIVVSYAPWGGLASSVPFSENPQKDRKIIQCKARACTSFVTFEPKVLDFGDTDVGALKSLPIKLINQSEISAIVQLDFQSKVLNCSPSGAITLPPKSGTELKLDIYPRKVNPDYRKQLTLFNLTNRANDQIIEVRSTNIDKNRVTFHSLFYRVLYPGGSNFLDFGNVVLGGISLRTITISNFTRNWLTLEITTSLIGELLVYERAREHQTYLNLNQVSGLLTNGPDSSPRSNSRRASPIIGDSGVTNIPAGDGTKTYQSKRQDQHSATGSEPSTPAVIGSATLASSLALKAKAILFHGDLTQTSGSAPATFLDLATNKTKEAKKVTRRIPTMKELLEPASRSKSGSAERPGKSSGTGNHETTPRSPRSRSNAQQSAGLASTESGLKRQEPNTRLTQRSTDPKSLQNNGLGQASANTKRTDDSLVNERSLDIVLAAMDANSRAGGSTMFFKPAEEELYVKERMKLTRELQNAITSKELIQISDVSIPPETEHQLVILFTPSSTVREHIKGIPKNQDARIFLRLVDFDRETVANNPQFRPLLDGDLGQIPLREIIVRSSLVRSIMDLGQNNINFGVMDKGEKRTKTIVIQNRSKEPLLYHIRKSGSIASGDIILGNGKSGVVRGYSKKEVDFIFEPSLSGLYHEKLAIENIQDPESSRILSVKANIRKPKHFSIDSQEVDFGPCSIGRKSAPKRITVTNSTKQTRTFEVRVDPHEMMPLSTEGHYGGEIEFALEDDAGQAVVTKEMEDEIEILEQKLKIAKRKGREDKVLKVSARLSLLRKGGVEDKVDSPTTLDVEDATPTQEKVLELVKADQSNSPVVETPTRGTAVTTPTPTTPVTTPTIKDVPKFKRTDYSIVFTLEGGKTKSVSAIFTPLYGPLHVASAVVDKERSRVQGKIYVHEHKNRDICRDVTFFATVECSSRVDIASKDDQHRLDHSAASTKDGSTDGIIKHDSVVPEGAMVGSDNLAKVSEPVENGTIVTEPVAPPEHLTLSPTEFDGGKIEQGQHGSFYFKLSNSSDDPLPYRIELDRDAEGVSRFVLDDSAMEGSLERKETRRITFGYNTQHLGRHRDTLKVVNLLSQSSFEFVFTCFSHRAQYLAFPSLDDSMTLDLGHCYVDAGRKYSQITPLLVENITDDDVYIACASNLSQQVAIFLDEQAEKGQVTRTLLKKRSMLTVWVAVQPNLLGGTAGGNTSRRVATSSGAMSSTSKDRDSECRTLVGGIKFAISLPEEMSTTTVTETTPEETTDVLTQVLSQTVKFTSIIGRSILSVSDTLLNLGWTPDVGKPVYGSFTLQNMSSRLPLDFRIESLSGNIILDRAGGILDGWDVEERAHSIGRSRVDGEMDHEDHEDQEGTESAPTDHSRLWISFRVTVPTPGLFTDTILVTNKNNCSQQIEIKVRLFVDPRRLLTTMHGPGYTCPMTMDEVSEIQDFIKPGVPREGLSLPSLSWENVYVHVNEPQGADGEETQAFVSFQPPYGETGVHVEERWIELSNNGEEVMELVPLCDIEVDTLWDQGGSEPIEDQRSDDQTPVIDGFHICGSVLRVAPGKKIQLLISCPSPDLPASDIDRLQSGKNVSLVGNLMVMDRAKNQVVKVLGLSSTYGVSYAEVMPRSCDVGKIGHYNSWNLVRVNFEVKNSSEIPLHYEIVLQDYMSLCQPSMQSGGSGEILENRILGTKRTIQAQRVDRVDVLLDPKRIDHFEIGHRVFPIRIVNLNNPENEMLYNINATLTEFELGFDRLSEGKLVLPPLTHPLPSSALPCDTWFSITNKSSEDVRFEVWATLSPDVIDFVRLDVLSRFSNSPLRGTISLSPRGTIEVRVRAFPKEGSRLPSDTSALCRAEGLIFGSLWVSTKSLTQGEESNGNRAAENIPIYGTLVEGSLFALSTQRIVFRSLLETSDYEGESDDEQLSVPESSNYSSSKDVSDDGIGSEIQQASIVISNLSMTFPLEFQVTLEGPMEYPAAEIINVTPLDSNNCGTVEAGQQMKLVVELIDPRLVISEDIKLFIRNLNSKLGQQQRVLISIVSDNREHRKSNKKQQVIEDERIDPHHHQNKLEESSMTSANGATDLAKTVVTPEVDTSALQPVISLRGCKRIDSGDTSGGRYELDLGQQDMGSANVLRKLVLENPGYDRVSYRIKTIAAQDRNWLKISRLEGTLEAPSEERLSAGSSSVQTITLGFVTNVRNVFSTYLLVENVDNPADTKTIRVTMEVVARQNLRRATKGNEANNRVFDVYVNGIDYKNSSSIDMKNLYYGSEYTARSMVVYNRETVPMEFTFKSNITPSDSTELLFSTSRTSAKLFKTLTVPAENHVRVYIRFFPQPSAAIQAALDTGEYRDPDEMELKTVEIYINCRLVKDYQHVVLLTAECYMPALRVDWQDSVSFVGRVYREPVASSETTDEWKLSFLEDHRILGISNLLKIPLDYEIVNDTMYFNLEYPEPEKVLDGLQNHQIRVVPNMKALLRNAENFRREKYVQENITIYNRNRPLENYWIPLRLSFGNVSSFQLSSGYKSSYAFGMIEQHVVNFLSDFNSHAVLVTMGNSSGCFSGTLGGASTGGGGANSSSAGGSGFGFGVSPGVGLGPDRGPSPSVHNNGSNHSSSLPASSGLTPPLIMSTPYSGSVAGMLGLGRTSSALVTTATSVYHAPSHHPHYQSLEAQENQRKLIDLEFQYHYVVDQLVYYSTIKTGENFFQLASLLFCTLLGNRIFQIWSPAYLKDPLLADAIGSSGTGGNSAGGLSSPSIGAGHMPGACGGMTGTVEYDESGERPIVVQPSETDGLSIHRQQYQHHHHRQQDSENLIRVWPPALRKWVEALDYFVSFFPYHARQLETLKALHQSLISS
ncbi:hypothetical protein BGZ50_000692 [Haplosporangium sp. Z 11]|nr:hypothetical protein BGZ50_000692 [Haplosporangium sp. Z 11]